MVNNLIDMDLLDVNDGRNPFEEIMSKLESLHLQGKYSFDKNEMEKNILYLERKFQDYNDEDEAKSKFILQAVNASFVILDSDNSYVSIVKERIKDISNITKKLDSYTDGMLQSIELSNFIANTNVRSRKLEIDLLLNAYTQAYHISLDMDEEDCWNMEMNFDPGDKKLHLPLEFIHTFIEGLNTIEGVEVSLEDIKVGSIKSRLNVNFTSESGKKAFMSVMSDLQGIVSANIDQNADQSQNQEGLDQEQVESVKLDNERKRLENEAIRFKNFVDKKKILAELLKEGIITQRNFEMLIKGIPFLNWEDGVMTIGESIDVIDNL